MGNQISPFPPCPKCGDEQRTAVIGYTVGLHWEDIKSGSDAIVCLSCGYVELYARPKTLEAIKDRIRREGEDRNTVNGLEKSWTQAYKEHKGAELEAQQQLAAKREAQKALNSRVKAIQDKLATQDRLMTLDPEKVAELEKLLGL